MEDFRKEAKKSIKFFKAVIIAALLLWIFLNCAVKLSGESRATTSGDGFCAIIIVFMAMNISRYSKALKNDEELKKLYIAETDERERLIYEKTNSASFRTTAVVLGLFTMVASFYSETMFYTLAAVIFIVAVIYAVFNFYYRRKY